MRSLSIWYFIYSEIYSLRMFLKHRREFNVLITYQSFLGLLVFLAALFTRKRIVLMYVDEYEELADNPFVKAYYRLMMPFFFRRSSHVVATAKLLVDQVLPYNSNVTYLPNGIDLDKIENKTIRPKDKERFTVGFVGSLGSWVDVDWLIDLCKHDPDVDVWVIGDGERMDALVTARESFNLENLKLYGMVPHEEVFAFIASFDIAVIPFVVNKVTDSVSPVKLFEYWALEKPVIVSRTQELLQFDNDLLIVRSNVEFIQAVENLKNNPEYLTSLGQAGKSRVKEYDWRSYANKLEKIVWVNK